MLTKDECTSSSPELLHWLLPLLFLTTACNTQKYLQEDEALLHKYKVEVISDQPSSVKNELRNELTAASQQKPNDRAFIFFKPRLYFYYRQQEKQDTSDFDKFIQNKLMEPPSIYDTVLTDESRLSMYDLLYRKGYLQAQVWYADTISSQKAQVTYFARPNQLYTIDTFSIVYPNREIELLVESKGAQSFLRSGRALSLTNLNSEKQRILELLQDEGYTDFSYSNFDLLEVSDTMGGKASASLRILPGTEGQLSVKQVGSVTVYNRSETAEFKENDVLVIHDSITFVNFDRDNSVRPTSLLRYIVVRPGDKLSKSKINQTRAQLQLPAIKFANPRLIPRSDDPSIVDIEIDLIREIKINVETSYQLSQNRVNSLALLGLTGSISLRNNNFLGGSELLSNDVSGSVELAPRDQVINAINLNFSNSLEFPRFADYLGIYKMANKLGLLKDRQYDALKSGASSILNADYEYVDLVDFYRYQSIDLDFGFRSTFNTVNTARQLQITNPSITYFNPTTRDSFNLLYEAETFARKSFAPQFFTSVLFNELTYVVEKSASVRGYSSAFISQFEVSGLEAMLVNLIVNNLSEPLKIGDLTFAQFARLDLDGRLYKQINADQSLAFRANIGLALPFGTSDFIPYVKQFFLGGPNTIRAWKIRELGPGESRDQTITRDNNRPFFQAGDLKILLNAEYRFDVYWRIEGAIFIDAGNIWTLKPDEREGGVFTSSFLDQIAVGSGMGLRFDADYFKVVLDVGLKVRNPYGDENQRHFAILPNIPTRELINFNFAINYPF